MQAAAVFLTNQQVFAGFGEAIVEFGNLSGNQHHVDPRADDEKSVDHVRRRCDEAHVGADGNVDLVGSEVTRSARSPPPDISLARFPALLCDRNGDV